MFDFISGGFSSGALDPDSLEGTQKALSFYMEIRHDSHDLQRLKSYEPFTVTELAQVKLFLFFDKHSLHDGYLRYMPSLEIASSWHRLCYQRDEVQYFDRLLIPHEYYEMALMNEGFSQEDAHKQSSLIFPYQFEYARFYGDELRKGLPLSDDHYQKLKKKYEAMCEKDDLNHADDYEVLREIAGKEQIRSSSLIEEDERIKTYLFSNSGMHI